MVHDINQTQPNHGHPRDLPKCHQSYMYITCITITIPKMEAGNARKLMEKNAHPTRFEIGKNPTCTVKLREREKKKE